MNERQPADDTMLAGQARSEIDIIDTTRRPRQWQSVGQVARRIVDRLAARQIATGEAQCVTRSTPRMPSAGAAEAAHADA